MNDTFSKLIALIESDNYAEFNNLRQVFISEMLLKNFPDLWPQSNFEISIGIGWIDIIRELCEEIQLLIKNNPGINVKFLQIKEKFGGLRAYVRIWSVNEDGTAMMDENGIPSHAKPHDEIYHQIDRLIASAEAKAEKTCRVCREPGEQHHGSFAVVCNKHIGK